jgi:beta-aspartyl-peptidase (threonine type)
MGKLSIAVHAGAGPDSAFIRKYEKEMRQGLKVAVDAGYKILKKNGKAADAVEAAVKELEDNWLFNAGRGAAINAKGEIEMCASIMDGKTLNSGAVAIVKNVRNPVSLAKAIMEKTKYIYLGDSGALDYARQINIELAPDAYFVVPYQYDEFEKALRSEYESTEKSAEEQVKKRMHGTVGAVAVDFEGNVAAATSTGGTPNCKEGRIGDSSMIGVGTYANNETCAISATGDGEYLIRNVICHSVSQVIFHKNISVNAACKKVIHSYNANVDGDMGVVAVDKKGNIAFEFNSERMLRGWKQGERKTITRIYKNA